MCTCVSPRDVFVVSFAREMNACHAFHVLETHPSICSFSREIDACIAVCTSAYILHMYPKCVLRIPIHSQLKVASFLLPESYTCLYGCMYTTNLLRTLTCLFAALRGKLMLEEYGAVEETSALFDR